MDKVAHTLQSFFTMNHKGVLVEVGASHPMNISVSFRFRPVDVQRKLWKSYFAHSTIFRRPVGDWEIISIEPNPDFCEQFKIHNLPVLQYACTNKDIGETSFMVSPCPASCSALGVRISGYDDKLYRKISVTALKLDTILSKHHPEIEHIDILVIDVEGWSMEVLEGFDFNKYKPELVLLEAYGLIPSGDYTAYMNTLGYDYIKDISPNMLFKIKNNDTI